jgi:hypothetical protein
LANQQCPGWLHRRTRIEHNADDKFVGEAV